MTEKPVKLNKVQKLELTIKEQQRNIDGLVEYVNTMNEKINALILFVQRTEAILDLNPPPEAWGITEERIIKIAETKGIPPEEVRARLIRNFGQDTVEVEVEGG